KPFFTFMRTPVTLAIKESGFCGSIAVLRGVWKDLTTSQLVKIAANSNNKLEIVGCSDIDIAEMIPLFMRLMTFVLLILFSFYTGELVAMSEEAYGLQLDWLDRGVEPAQNFFKFANGNWQKQNPIPPAYGR